MINNNISFLYKYQPFNIHSIENLINRHIWFSSPQKLNDPLDGQNIFRIIEPDENKWVKIFKNFESKKYPKFQSLFEYINTNEPEKSAEMKDMIRILAYEDIYLSINERKCIACFSKTNNRYLMWSHYADGHRGFCLEFKSNRFPFNEAIDVTYVNNYIWFDLEEILTGEIIIEKYLSEKTEIWIYEEEKRLIDCATFFL